MTKTLWAVVIVLLLLVEMQLVFWVVDPPTFGRRAVTLGPNEKVPLQEQSTSLVFGLFLLENSVLLGLAARERERVASRKILEHGERIVAS